MSQLKLKDKVVFITGGGDGMGRSTSILAAQEGAKIAIFELNAENQEETVRVIRENGHQAIGFTGNVINEEEVRLAIEETVKTFGGIDVLINNVGINLEGLLHETTTEHFDRTMKINLYQDFFTSKYAIPYMLEKKKGAIINISSAAGIKTQRGTPVYSTAKAGVIMLTQAMALQYAPLGIRVNSVAPGLVRTAMNSARSNEYIESVAKAVPMLRPGQKEEIARATIWLASDEASYITGVTIPVDGGLSLA